MASRFTAADVARQHLRVRGEDVPERKPAKRRVRKPDPRPPERDIQRAIMAALALLPNVFVERMNTGAMTGEYKGKQWFVRFGSPGAPDIRCVVAGRAVFLEVKRPGGKQSPDQVAWQRAAESAGAFYRVVTSVDEALAAVREAGGER